MLLSISLRDCRLPSVLWLLLLLAINAGAVRAQDALTSPLLSADPLKTAERQNALRQTQAEQRVAIEQLRQDIAQLEIEQPSKLQALQDETVTIVMVDQARLNSDALQLQQANVQAGIDNAQRRIKEIEQAIAELEVQEQLLKNPAKNDRPETGNRAEQRVQVGHLLEQRRTDLELEQENLQTLNEWLALLAQRRTLAGLWRARVEELHLQQQSQERQEAQQDRAAQMERQQQAKLSKIEELRARLQRDGEQLSEAQRSFLKISIQTAETHAQLLRWDHHLATISGELTHWEGVVNAQNTAPRRLQEGLRRLTVLRGELRETGQQIEPLLERFNQQQPLTPPELGSASNQGANEQTRQLLTSIARELHQRQDLLHEHIDRLDRLRERLETIHTQRTRQDLLARESWDLLTQEQWPATAVELSQAPRILLHQLWLSVESALAVIPHVGVKPWFSLAGLILLLTALAALGRRRLARFSERCATEQDGRFANQFVLTVARLLRRNLWGIALAAALALGLWLIGVPQPGLAILLTLVLLWVSIKTPLDLAWLLLAAPDLPATQHRPRLYTLVFWMLLSGGMISALVILAHVSELPLSAIRVLDQAFLIYWLAACYPLLRLRRLLLEGLAERYAGQFWFEALRLLTLLLPVALAGAALLSLIGYLNLAWVIVWRLLTLAGVLLIWLLLRSLVDEWIVLLKNQAILYSNYGLLWTQDILAPLNGTLRWLLLLMAGATLLDLYSEQGFLFTFWTSVAWRPVLITFALVLVGYEGLLILAGWLVEQTQSASGSALIRHLRQPLGWLAPMIAAQLLLPTLELSALLTDRLQHALVLINIAAIGWLLVRLTSVAEDVLQQHYLINIKDNLGARRVRTQFQMVRRIAVIVVQILALSVMMMTFPKIRELGAGLLASAGVAGIVIGVAARPFLENLIAGVQIGLTQPIRIEDVVIVEGEWGRIAEINATHVVVRIWDDRRLIVPLNYFNTKPFQNWTWASADLLGTAFFSVDYTFPVDAGRQELKRILDESGLWDGRAWGLQVTDTTERTVTLRALMSAPDASTAWNLRCLVRERFIAFLQANYPQCLPQTRLSESRQAYSAPR